MMNNFITNAPLDNFMILRQLDRYMAGHKGYIAGGVFKNIFTKEPFKDVDIFFESEKDFVAADLRFSADEEYVLVYENKKVRAYRNIETKVTVELIRHTFAHPLEMTNDFDFTITKFVYYKETDIGPFGEEDFEITWKIAYHKQFFEHLMLKRLVIDRPVDELILPTNTFNRMFRYAKYGYFPCRETKAKIIEAMRALPNFSDELLSMELYNGMD